MKVRDCQTAIHSTWCKQGVRETQPLLVFFPRFSSRMDVCLPMGAKSTEEVKNDAQCAESGAPHAPNSQKVRKNLRAARVKTAPKSIPNSDLGKAGRLENEHGVYNFSR